MIADRFDTNFTNSHEFWFPWFSSEFVKIGVIRVKLLRRQEVAWAMALPGRGGRGKRWGGEGLVCVDGLGLAKVESRSGRDGGTAGRDSGKGAGIGTQGSV